jgi:hypothetical protein
VVVLFRGWHSGRWLLEDEEGSSLDFSGVSKNHGSKATLLFPTVADPHRSCASLVDSIRGEMLKVESRLVCVAHLGDTGLEHHLLHLLAKLLSHLTRVAGCLLADPGAAAQ